MPPGAPRRWLTLKDAAARLGVHPATLRRWADAGRLPVALTPGGHRRVAPEDLERFEAEARQAGTLAARGGVAGAQWAHQAIVHTRAGLAEHQGDGWMRRLDGDARHRARELGHQMMGLLLQHLADASDDPGADAGRLAEVHRLGGVYAGLLVRGGLSLSQATRATMFFRDTLLESTTYFPQGRPERPEHRMRLMRRLNGFLNALQLAITQAYDPAEPDPVPGA